MFPLKLLEIASMIVAAEEVVNRSASSSKTIELSNQTINPSGKITVIDLKGMGRLHELLIISSTNLFKVTITVDGTIVWDKSFDEASLVASQIGSVSAFQRDDGKYIYHISNIPFSTGIKVEISSLDTSNPITLDYVFGKYERR